MARHCLSTALRRCEFDGPPGPRALSAGPGRGKEEHRAGSRTNPTAGVAAERSSNRISPGSEPSLRNRGIPFLPGSQIFLASQPWLSGAELLEPDGFVSPGARKRLGNRRRSRTSESRRRIDARMSCLQPRETTRAKGLSQRKAAHCCLLASLTEGLILCVLVFMDTEHGAAF